MHLNIAFPHITSASNNYLEKLHQLKADTTFALTIKDFYSFEAIFLQSLVGDLDKASGLQLLD